jgi:hypothetical protein
LMNALSNSSPRDCTVSAMGTSFLCDPFCDTY